MEKIVITGGLGYIGTELCKLYSGEARYKNIVVIDNRFISERVKQLRDWGITFVQCDLLDSETMAKHLAYADIVHHLAGITDVAYTKTESNSEKDKQISTVAIEGTKIVLKSIPSHCKIIFPSTHVVFEGFDTTKFDLTEDTMPTPVLTYSKSKVTNENDVNASTNPSVILRLGSVYGYSTDTMRINIMPNLFSKMASQNAIIKMFGGGVQHKSLVALIDVARCFKFMAESKYKNETFHLSNENMTVKDVAMLVKKHKPECKVIATTDEIPNLGYTISNKKLLNTGFKFLYNIDDSIKEMVNNWSDKTINPELEYIDKGGKELIDARGIIKNYELTEPINLIGYIESKTGSVRANHYHPIQEQKCLLIKGQYISVIQDLSVPNAPVETKIINEGDMAIIKPNVAHTMIFTKDSIFLNLVRGEREHDNYGITHTIPFILVDEATRVKLLESYKLECRSCGNKHLKRVISLGDSPLANNLTNSNTEVSEQYPLEVDYCPKCHNCQLSCVVPAGKMFDNYLYVSSTSASFRKHFEDAAVKYINYFKLTSESTVIDIGSNDGIALKPLNDKGINVIGVEPATNVAKIANDNGIPTLNQYFTDKTFDKKHFADLVTASNVFAHADDLKGITKNVFNVLKENGTFIVEVQYLLDTINDLTFDNIYHEHVNYWSLTSMVNFFKNLGYVVTDVEHINTHGGSIRVYINNLNSEVKPSVAKYLQDEKDFGLLDFNTYKEFSVDVAEIKKNVNKNIEKLKASGKKIAGYGSPAKATTALNYFGVNHSHIDYIIEDNKLKDGKYIPCVNIPIKNKEYCFNNLPDIIIVMAWNFFEDIKRNNQELIEKGVTFISIKDLQNNDFKLPKENYVH
jgi:nucleoside-diphosphate-sugar epimerase/SAM-dependent methyltransferase